MLVKRKPGKGGDTRGRGPNKPGPFEPPKKKSGGCLKCGGKISKKKK